MFELCWNLEHAMMHCNILLQPIPLPNAQVIKRAKQYRMLLHVWDVGTYVVRVGERMSSLLLK